MAAPPTDVAADELVLVLSTAPDQATGERIATALVEERLVACVNLVPDLLSVYRWRGEVQREGEVLLLIKTRAARLAELKQRLPQIHPYEVPELIALPIRDGLETYCRWVADESAGGAP